MAKFFVYPFGTAGDLLTIPNTGPVAGPASYQYGFGDDYELDLQTDPAALPIPRNQFNQLMFDITTAIRQYQTEGAPDFITTSDNLGSPYPYDIYARVRYNDGTNGFQVYESMVGTNTALPSDATKWRVISNNSGGVIAGTIIDYGGLVVPAGYLACDGVAVSRTTYAALLAATTTSQTGTASGINVTGLSDTSKFRVGMKVEGTLVAAGTSIASIVSGTAITLSASATAGSSSFTFFVNGNGDGALTFNTPDMRGYTTVGQGGGVLAGILNNTPGSRGGESAHSQTAAEVGVHGHTSSVGSSVDVIQTGTTGITHLNSIPPGTPFGVTVNDNQVSVTPMNITQLSYVTYKCIKF